MVCFSSKNLNTRENELVNSEFARGNTCCPSAARVARWTIGSYGQPQKHLDMWMQPCVYKKSTMRWTEAENTTAIGIFPLSVFQVGS